MVRSSVEPNEHVRQRISRIQGTRYPVQGAVVHSLTIWFLRSERIELYSSGQAVQRGIWYFVRKNTTATTPLLEQLLFRLKFVTQPTYTTATITISMVKTAVSQYPEISEHSPLPQSSTCSRC